MNTQELKAMRLAAGLTQAALARCLDVNTGTVGCWERGRWPPPERSLKLWIVICDETIQRKRREVADLRERLRPVTRLTTGARHAGQM